MGLPRRVGVVEAGVALHCIIHPIRGVGGTRIAMLEHENYNSWKYLVFDPYVVEMKFQWVDVRENTWLPKATHIFVMTSLN